MRVSLCWLAGVAAVSAVLLSSSASVLAADIAVEPEPAIDENFWYLSLHGGIKFGEDWDDGSEYFGDIEFNADNGWRAGGAIGYSLTSIFALEGEISFMNQDIESDYDWESYTISAIPLSEDCCDDGDVSVLTGMVNVVAGVMVGTFMRPYVGAGIGVAHVSLNDVGLPAPFDLDDSDNVFAMQGFAGVDLMLSEGFALGARYRLLHLGDVKLEDNDGGEHDLDPDLIHSIEAVLTVGF